MVNKIIPKIWVGWRRVVFFVLSIFDANISKINSGERPSHQVREVEKDLPNFLQKLHKKRSNRFGGV